MGRFKEFLERPVELANDWFMIRVEKMSGRGIDSLENWIQQNVTEADKKGSRERAKELADKCVADAAANGITADDMEPEWGSVETIVHEAM